MTKFDLVRFMVPLGYYLPTPDNLRITSFYHDFESLAFAANRSTQTTLSFNHIRNPEGGALARDVTAQFQVAEQIGLVRPTGNSASSDAHLEAVETVVDVVTEMLPLRERTKTDDPRKWHPLSDPILTGLLAINGAIRAVTHSLERHFPEVPYESLPSLLVMYRAFADGSATTNPDWNWEIPSSDKWRTDGIVHLAHTNIPLAQRDSDLEQRTEAEFRRHVRSLPHPFRLYRERAIKARYLFKVGSYSDCVTLLSTSMETMLVSLTMHLLWESYWPDIAATEHLKEARYIFSNLERRSAVRKELSSRLGGNWTSDRSAWETWNEAGVELRNRVVHSGHTPSFTETERAIKAHDEMTRFVADRISQQTGRYPRTAIKLVGKDGLRRRDRWTGRISHFNDKVAPNEPDWEHSFTTWVDEVISPHI